MSPEEDRLLRLAEAVADESGIDWGDEIDDDSRVHRLREIEAVAAAYRSAATESPESLFRWGHLEVLERLGEGAFGEVFRARDTVLDRDVALKLRRPGPTPDVGSGRRFVQEARRLARVRHENVLTVFGADLNDGRVGLWTELVEGRVLSNVLAEEGPLGAREAVAVGLDLCRALAAVHAAGLIHGDVKAANVFRERGGRMVLGDFGAAVDSSNGVLTFASPGSAAPELLHGKASRPSSDLYSLGVLLYQLVSGHLPVEGKSLEELLENLDGDHAVPLRDRRPDLPASFIEVVEHALEVDQGRRFSTAGEMERALIRCLEGADLEYPKPKKRRLWPVAATLGVAAAAGVALVLLLLPNESPEQHMAPDAEVGGRLGTASSQELETAASEAAAPLAVTSALYSDAGDEVEPLLSGDSIAPGDWLYLDVECREEIHAYVLNSDRRGDLFVLFPIPGLDLANPLPPGRHRLPGSVRGVRQDWQVTSAGGRETFLVVASRQPLPELEEELSGFRAAGEMSAGAGAGTVATLRGVGGLVDAEPPGDSQRLDAIYEGLRSRQNHDNGIWLSLVELENPTGL